MAKYINIDRIHYYEKENIDGYVYSEYVYKNEIEDLALIVFLKLLNRRDLYDIYQLFCET